MQRMRAENFKVYHSRVSFTLLLSRSASRSRNGCCTWEKQTWVSWLSKVSCHPWISKTQLRPLEPQVSGNRKVSWGTRIFEVTRMPWNSRESYYPRVSWEQESKKPNKCWNKGRLLNKRFLQSWDPLVFWDPKIGIQWSRSPNGDLGQTVSWYPRAFSDQMISWNPRVLDPNGLLGPQSLVAPMELLGHL